MLKALKSIANPCAVRHFNVTASKPPKAVRLHVAVRGFRYKTNMNLKSILIAHAISLAVIISIIRTTVT